MNHSFLFFYFVGTIIQLQMNFGIHFIYNMMLFTNVKYTPPPQKKKKNWCSVTAVLTPVPRWTFMDSYEREARPHALEDSVSTGWLSKPTMNARDTPNEIIDLLQLLNRCTKY